MGTGGLDPEAKEKFELGRGRPGPRGQGSGRVGRQGTAVGRGGGALPWPPGQAGLRPAPAAWRRCAFTPSGHVSRPAFLTPPGTWKRQRSRARCGEVDRGGREERLARGWALATVGCRQDGDAFCGGPLYPTGAEGRGQAAAFAYLDPRTLSAWIGRPAALRGVDG